MRLIVNDYEELKDVENFLFRFKFPKPFSLQIVIESTDEFFNYTTQYNDLAKGWVLETF